jgi:hypothetical protein
LPEATMVDMMERKKKKGVGRKKKRRRRKKKKSFNFMLKSADQPKSAKKSRTPLFTENTPAYDFIIRQ